MAERDGKTIRASDWAEAGRKIRNDEGSILHGVIAEVHSLDHLHGAKQPGRLQRGVRLIELRRSEGVGLGGIRLAIANDAIRPAIRYQDLHLHFADRKSVV